VNVTSPAPSSVPLRVDDVSAFCKNLRQRLVDSDVPAPSHLTLLNVIAKSAGYRNYQALRAAAAADPTHTSVPPQPLTPPSGSTLPKVIARALGHFDTAGRLTRFPLQRSVRDLALLGIWCQLPGKRDLTEKQVNEYLKGAHTFADHVSLRRELVNTKRLWRTTDGSRYRKEAPPMSAVDREFLNTLHQLTRQKPRG
jgi:hypothetical protein